MEGIYHSNAADIILSANTGVQSPVNSTDILAQNISGLIDNPSLTEEMEKNAIEYFLNCFERKVVTRQWYALIATCR